MGVSVAAAGSVVIGCVLSTTGQRVKSPSRTLRKAVMYGMVGAGKTIEDKFNILKDTWFRWRC